MNCPMCEDEKNRTVDSRTECDNVWRVRVCQKCGYRWRTVEIDNDMYNSLTGAKNKKKERKTNG